MLRQFAPTKTLGFTVTYVKLNNFEFRESMSGNGTLYYDIDFSTIVENPNPWANVHFDEFEAIASYKNQDLNNVTVHPFTIAHQDTEAVPTSFKGKSTMALPGYEVSKFKSNTTAIFNILLDIYIRSSCKMLFYEQHYQMKCYLKVPKHSTGEKFETTKCRRIFIFD